MSRRYVVHYVNPLQSRIFDFDIDDYITDPIDFNEANRLAKQFNQARDLSAEGHTVPEIAWRTELTSEQVLSLLSEH